MRECHKSTRNTPHDSEISGLRITKQGRQRPKRTTRNRPTTTVHWPTPNVRTAQNVRS